MSWAEFDTLRTDPVFGPDVVGRTEDYVRSAFRRDATGVLDETLVSDGARIPIGLAEKLLVRLVETGLLETRFLWLCANGNGTTAEERTVNAFPSTIECDRCGQLHTFSADHVEVGFIATQELLDHVQRVTE